MGHLPACLRMADRWVCGLLFAANVMQQAGGDQHVMIHMAFPCRDIKRSIQYAADVVPVMRAVAHMAEHMGFYQFKGLLCHVFRFSFNIWRAGML
jgi:hypothetical protein